MEVKRICQWCGKPFIAKKTTTNYCSHQCASQGYKHRMKERRIELRELQELIEVKSKLDHQYYFTFAQAAQLMGVSRQYILHQNKSDENARGHIGTEINNKAETVIQIEKDKDDSNISKVESVHTRSKDFLPFAFCINAQSLPELLPDYVPTKKSVGRPKLEPFSPYKDIHEAIHRKVLELAFDGKEMISGYKALEEELTTAYELAGTKFNHNKIVKIIKFLTNKRMVVQESRGIYRFMPDYHY